MINLDSIKKFDKIYQIKYEEHINQSDFINTYFGTVKEYIDFIKSNEDLFINPEGVIIQNLDGDGIVVGVLPEFNSEGLNKYYEYKKKQFIENEKITLNYDFHDIDEILNVKNSKALKLLIDYFIDSNLIKMNDEYAHKNIIGNYEFDFSNIKVIKSNENKTSNNVTNIETQININGNKNKLKNIDISHNKKELEKESWWNKLMNMVFSLLKRKK